MKMAITNLLNLSNNSHLQKIYFSLHLITYKMFSLTFTFWERVVLTYSLNNLFFVLIRVNSNKLSLPFSENTKFASAIQRGIGLFLVLF